MNASMLNTMLKNWGSPVCAVERETGKKLAEANAVIMPLRYQKNKLYLTGVQSPAGYQNPGYYTYIGPPALDLTGAEYKESFILYGGLKYMVQHADKVMVKGKDFYIWAVLQSVAQRGETE